MAGIQFRQKDTEVFIYFADRRDADCAMKMFNHLRHGDAFQGPSGVSPRFISAKAFCESTRDANKPSALASLGRTFETGFEGQMVFAAQPFDNISVNAHVEAHAKITLKKLIDTLTDVYRVSTLSVDPMRNMVTILVDLYIPRMADEVIKVLRDLGETKIIEVSLQQSNPLNIAHHLFQNMRVTPCLRGESSIAPVHAHHAPANPTLAQLQASRQNSFGNHLNTSLPDRPSLGAIGEKRALPLMQSLAQPFLYNSPLPDEFSFNYNDEFSYNYNYGRGYKHNDVKNIIHLEKIRRGLDVRTTVSTNLSMLSEHFTNMQLQVMLRNIPNRLTHVRTYTIESFKSHGG